jgi:hypothetical protein
MSLLQPVSTGSHDLDTTGFVPYVWRDPARVTAVQARRLAAHDEKYAGRPANPGNTMPHRRYTRPEEEALRLEFARWRTQGLSIKKASAATGISPSTGSRWDRQQREAMTQ